MNQNTKNYLIILTVFILSGLLFSLQPNTLFANSVTESVYSDYNDYYDREITKEKIWTITFREKMPRPSSLSNNIYISINKNERNKVKRIKVKIDENNPKVVTVSPSSKWIVGKTYYLFVNKNLKFTNSKIPLPKTVRMKFTIVKDEKVVDSLRENKRYSENVDDIDNVNEDEFDNAIYLD